MKLAVVTKKTPGGHYRVLVHKSSSFHSIAAVCNETDVTKVGLWCGPWAELSFGTLQMFLALIQPEICKFDVYSLKVDSMLTNLANTVPTLENTKWLDRELWAFILLNYELYYQSNSYFNFVWFELNNSAALPEVHLPIYIIIPYVCNASQEIFREFFQKCLCTLATIQDIVSTTRSYSSENIRHWFLYLISTLICILFSVKMWNEWKDDSFVSFACNLF